MATDRICHSAIFNGINITEKQIHYQLINSDWVPIPELNYNILQQNDYNKYSTSMSVRSNISSYILLSQDPTTIVLESGIIAQDDKAYKKKMHKSCKTIGYTSVMGGSVGDTI